MFDAHERTLERLHRQSLSDLEREAQTRLLAEAGVVELKDTVNKLNEEVRVRQSLTLTLTLILTPTLTLTSN